MNKYIRRARQMRAQLDNITKGFTDEQAVVNKELYPDWKSGVELIKDSIVYYDENLYRVLQSHISQSDWTPDKAVSLFAKVLAGGEIEVWEQPDSTNGYMIGDKVYYPTKNDNIYESLINNNIWSPVAYPAGWKDVTE